MQAASEIEERVDALISQLRIQRATVRQIVAQVEALRQRYLTETNIDPSVIERAVDSTLERYFPTNGSPSPMPSVPSSGNAAVQWLGINPAMYPSLKGSATQFFPATSGIAQRPEASEEDANRKIAESSGFQSKRLAHLLERSINPPSYLSQPTIFAQYLYEALGVNYLDHEDKPMRPGITEINSAIMRIRNASPHELHGFFLKLIDRHGHDQLREAMWRNIDSDIILRDLIGGFGIYQPKNELGARRFEYFKFTHPGQRMSPGAAFSRYVFDRLFDQYVREGGRGDVLPAEEGPV